MRPKFGNEERTTVITDRGAIPWDPENNRVLDHTGDAARIYRQVLEENGMDLDASTPDPFEATPPIEPGPPSPMEVTMYEHECRLCDLEGDAQPTLDDFLKKYRGE